MTTSSATETNSKFVVLAAIDFWHGAVDVLTAAANQARAPGSELHVIHVLPAEKGEGHRANGGLHLSSLADDARARLAQLANTVPASVKRIDLHVRVGRADVEIAQVANDIGADLLVVGTHAHSTLDRVLLGSVSESLLRNAPCPVMAYRPKTIRTWEQITPACEDCIAVRKSSGRSRLWCDRHSEHHLRAHTYSEIPATYGVGAQTFR